MAPWTPADIPDLTGRTAVVTGANRGLGLETSMALARHGATVVMACRDPHLCEEAVRQVTAMGLSGEVQAMGLDLADLDSVRAFARELAGRHDRLDMLVNNAGVMAPPTRHTTKQGFELQIGVNHLGHFALTGLLLPLLLPVAGSRVVTVSSFAHESGTMDLDDLQSERRYTPYGAYSRSKLANLMFMLELDRRLRRAGAATISVAAHPGFSSTNLQAAGPFLDASPIRSWLTLAAVRLIGQSPAHGAEPQLYAATAPGVQGGDYYGPRHTISGHPVPSDMLPAARDEGVAARLWEMSKELTGVDVDAGIRSGVHGRAEALD